MPPSHPSPPRAGRREWIGLAIIALPCLVYAMDLTVLNLALPAISADLNPSSTQMLWILDIYGFLVAGFLITMGTLGDRLGRRKLLLIGAAAFGAASLLAAFSRSAEMLIAMRALLGVAGATLAPSTMSLIRNMFHDTRERQFAIGVWIASFSLGSAIGPLVGGLLLQFFPWGAVFLPAVPVMGVLLLLGPTLLPEYRDPNAGRIDLLSVAQSLASTLLLIYGLKQLAGHGPGIVPVAAVLAGLALGALFLRRQRTLEHPVLDLTLFRQPAFTASIAAYALSCLAMFGVYLHIAQYLQGVLDLSPLHAGLATLPWSLAFLAGSLLAPKLGRHLPPTRVLVWGLVVAAAGIGMLVFAHGPLALPVLIAGTVVIGLSLAPVFTLGNEIIITAAPAERAGAASALAETSSEFSGALGIALFGSASAVLYKAGLSASMPAGVPPDVADLALSTLGSAVAAAHGLAEPMGPALVAASKATFTGVLQVVCAAAAGITLAAAVLAAKILRGRHDESQVRAADECDANC